MQVDVHTATGAALVLREADARPISCASTAIIGQAQRHWHGGPVSSQPSFNWKVLDKNVELLNFEMVVTNVL